MRLCRTQELLFLNHARTTYRQAFSSSFFVCYAIEKPTKSQECLAKDLMLMFELGNCIIYSVSSEEYVNLHMHYEFVAESSFIIE